MESLASASDDNADPGPDQFEFGVEARALIRVRGRAAGARRETRRIAPLAHSGTASRTASACAASGTEGR